MSADVARRWVAGTCLLVAIAAAANTPDAAPTTPPVVSDVLEEVIVSAPEPRYVAPTRRDRIGRIWAPVYINDKGPFRLVLDTGATTSGVIASVAEALALQPDTSSNVRLRGATGSTVVPTIKVNSLVIGDLLIKSKRLPILIDALGGADGVLGTEGLADKRIHIDFSSDMILIKRSHGERAARGFRTIPVKFSRGRLMIIDAMLGTVPIKAIIDTGGQSTIANMATRDALFKRRQKDPDIHVITGTTAETQRGEGYAVPPISIGDLQIRSLRMTFVDLHIFEQWGMLDKPAILLGMDALGLFDTLIIDYKRAELQVRLRRDN